MLTRCFHLAARDAHIFSVSRTMKGNADIELDREMLLPEMKDLVRSRSD